MNIEEEYIDFLHFLSYYSAALSPRIKTGELRTFLRHAFAPSVEPICVIHQTEVNASTVRLQTVSCEPLSCVPRPR